MDKAELIATSIAFTCVMALVAFCIASHNGETRIHDKIIVSDKIVQYDLYILTLERDVSGFAINPTTQQIVTAEEFIVTQVGDIWNLNNYANRTRGS